MARIRGLGIAAILLIDSQGHFRPKEGGGYFSIFFSIAFGKPQKNLFFLLARPLRRTWSLRKNYFFEALREKFPKQIWPLSSRGQGLCGRATKKRFFCGSPSWESIIIFAYYVIQRKTPQPPPPQACNLTHCFPLVQAVQGVVMWGFQKEFDPLVDEDCVPNKAGEAYIKYFFHTEIFVLLQWKVCPCILSSRRIKIKLPQTSGSKLYFADFGRVLGL